MDKGYQRPTARSRVLRANSTAPEIRLWSALRSKQVAGTRFNRQFPIGPFVCDFVARTPRLVVEVDGDTHSGREKSNASRTRYLEERGYYVIRFANHKVMTNLDGVVDQIVRALEDRPSPGPSRKREAGDWGPTVRWLPC